VILPDVNILVYAHRPDAENHIAYRTWLEDLLAGDRAFGMSDLVLSGFLRIVTNRRVFLDPSPIDKALAFADEVRTPSHCVPVRPGPRHWDIFKRLCQECSAKGNLVPDAFLAALAIEQGCEWITTDRDYARFNGLKWRHPLG
jgi:toxin-antitoxin system PIN domain toxin